MSSSPNSDHIEIGIDSCIDQGLDGVTRFIVWVLESWVEHIWRDIVSSLAIYLIAIYFYDEFFVLKVQLSCSDTKGYLLLFNNTWCFCRDKSDYKIIDEGNSNTIRPPELRIFDVNIIIWVLLSCWERCELIIIKNNLKDIIPFKLLHLPFKSNSKIDSCSFFADGSCSHPNIVYLYLVKGL